MKKSTVLIAALAAVGSAVAIKKTKVTMILTPGCSRCGSEFPDASSSREDKVWIASTIFDMDVPFLLKCYAIAAEKRFRHKKNCESKFYKNADTYHIIYETDGDCNKKKTSCFGKTETARFFIFKKDYSSVGGSSLVSPSPSALFFRFFETP